MSLKEIKYQEEPNYPSKNKLKEKWEYNIKIKMVIFFNKKIKAMRGACLRRIKRIYGILERYLC